MLNLDYSLQTPEERKELVTRILKENPVNQRYLEILADYLIFASKNDKILTDNRLSTINKRETSFEGLATKLENGEDGIYSLIANDKNIIFSPQVGITLQDIEEIPGMRELVQSIKSIEESASSCEGYKAYKLKRMLIEMRKDQYVLKNSYRKPIYFTKTTKSAAKLDLTEKVYIDENGEVRAKGILTLYNPDDVSLLLRNYSSLKEDTYSDFESDMRWMLLDLEDLIDEDLRINQPMLFDIMVYKIDGKSNQEIQTIIDRDYGICHSLEYISALWRNKIPKLIAQHAKEKWITWYYKSQKPSLAHWKRCSRCGETKLAHPYFFSKNSSSKSGYYSLCKKCRSKTEVPQKKENV